MPTLLNEDHQSISQAFSAIKEILQSARSVNELLTPMNSLFNLITGKKLKCKLPGVFTQDLCVELSEDNDDNFTMWLKQCFAEFLNVIKKFLNSSDIQLQIIAIRFLFRIARHEAEVRCNASGTALFPLSFYQIFIVKMLQVPYMPKKLQNHIVSQFLAKHPDLRCYFLVVVKKLLKEYEKTKSLHQNETKIRCHSKEMEGKQNKLLNSSTGNETRSWYTWNMNDCLLSERLIDFLLALPPPKVPSKKGGRGGNSKLSLKRRLSDVSNSGSSDSDFNSSSEGEKLQDHQYCYIPNLSANCKGKNPYQYRLAYQSVWLDYLLTVHHEDKEIMQRLLFIIPKVLLPYMSNPLLLSDFFLKAFKNGEDISLAILALSGMFYLFVKHRLGDPEIIDDEAHNQEPGEKEQTEKVCLHFYERLYQLITPAAFSARLRVRFLRLLNLTLKSSLLPTSLIASFIKRIVRVACVCPAAIGLSLTALAYTLMQRNYNSCKSLIHLPVNIGKMLKTNGDTFFFDCINVKKIKYNNYSVNGDKGKLLHHTSDDTSEVSTVNSANSQMRENDLLYKLISEGLPEHLKVKTELTSVTKRYAQMSLWELELLKKHYSAPARQICDLFGTNIGAVNAKQLEMDDFLSVTAGTLIHRDLKFINRSKNPAVAYSIQVIPEDAHRVFRNSVDLAANQSLC